MYITKSQCFGHYMVIGCGYHTDVFDMNTDKMVFGIDAMEAKNHWLACKNKCNKLLKIESATTTTNN
jgi:hypothetical protein